MRVKGKYFQALLFVGVLPILLLAGVYFWMKFTEAPPAPPVSSQTAQDSNYEPVSLLQSQVVGYASTLFSNIKKTHDDIPNLTAHNTDQDLSNFVESHPGVQGLLVVSSAGKVLHNLPPTPPLADPQYASSDEFKTILDRFQANPGQTYQFYTQRLNYPAFLFAQPLNDKSIAIAVFNLGHFFPTIDPKDTKSGVYFILDAASGRFFYHSNPSKLSETFNPNNEPWLSKVTNDLANKQAGSSLNPPPAGGIGGAVIYAPLGFGKLGVVNQVPYSTVIPPPPSPSPKAASKPTLENIISSIQSPFGLAIPILIAWVLLLGSLFLSGILGPLRKANRVIVNAAQGQGSITPETLKAFGSDEVGQIVQAAAMLMQNLEKDKQQIQQEKDDSVRQFRTQMDEKAREAAAQVSSAQQVAQGSKNDLAEKTQVLNDKLKELDALKGMSEGLRNQSEQAKNENAQLKGQLTNAEKIQAESVAKVQQTETKLKEMEAKLLSAVSAASAIQVSSVRAAAIRTMADELKTTLGIIKGYVSSALGTVQGGISEKQQEFLGMVINRSARLEKFINDLLDIYQVEIESEEAKREDVNLASEIEGLAFNFQAQAEVKTIKLRVDAAPNLPKVPIIRRRFNQLWNILYLQIIKDAPRGATIPITVEALGDNVKVVVEDPGLNVKTESLPRLYDEFYDPKHTASPQLAGTGLKFALVKTILAGHGGGAVAEKSEPGTRLILTFPTKYKKPSEVAAAAAATAAAAVSAPTAVPSLKASPAMGAKPIPPSPAPGPLGVPKALPLGSAPPAAKPPTTNSGVLDALIAGKVPPITAAPQMNAPPSAPGIAPRPTTVPGIPGMKPVPPSPGLTPKPATPSFGAPPLGSKLTPPAPGAPLGIKPPTPGIGSVPPSPQVKPITPPGSGVLDSLLGNKPVPPPSVPPSPAGPPPVARPGVPPAAGIPVRPPIVPPLGATPPIAPRPMGAPMTPPPMGIPRPVAPPPGPGAIPPPVAPVKPATPPAMPKVVPTSLKPTVPPGGVFDLDNVDTVKTGDEPSKPVTPPAPVRPASPAPGIPPGGLDAHKSITKDLSKESDGELIE